MASRKSQRVQKPAPPCPKCAGTGKVAADASESKKVVCPACKGTGKAAGYWTKQGE